MASSISPPNLISCDAIVGSQFCSSSPTHLSIERKLKVFGSRGYYVNAGNGGVVFKVKETRWISNLLLFDSTGTQILTLKHKSWSWHDRWQAFRFTGETTSPCDLLFSVKTLSSWKQKFGVFLASNREEKACDFLIEGGWSDKSCFIYGRDSSSVVAEIHRHASINSVFVGKGYFVTVHSGVDSALIVSLAIILAVKHEASKAAISANSAASAAAASAAAASAASC